MKLKEYIAGLQNVLDEHGDLECYYAKDAEGNGYEKVSYAGTVFYTSVLEYRMDNLYVTAEECEDDSDNEGIAICVVN